MVLSMKSIDSLQDANSIPQLSKNNHLLTVISGFSKRDRGKKWILTLAIFLFNLVLMLSVREPVKKKKNRECRDTNVRLGLLSNCSCLGS